MSGTSSGAPFKKKRLDRAQVYTVYSIYSFVYYTSIIKIENNHIYYAPPELNQVEVAQAQFKNSFHLILMRKKIHRNI